MLQSVETLTQQLYSSETSNAARTEAERQLSVFGTNPETIDQSRFILERSQKPICTASSSDFTDENIYRPLGQVFESTAT